MAVEDLMSSTITVYAKSAVRAGDGGISYTQAPLYSNVPASIQPASGQSLAAYGSMEVLESTHRIFSSTLMTLGVGDIVVDAQSITYAVTYASNPFQTYADILCKRTQL